MKIETELTVRKEGESEEEEREGGDGAAERQRELCDRLGILMTCMIDAAIISVKPGASERCVACCYCSASKRIKQQKRPTKKKKEVFLLNLRLRLAR